MRSNNPTRQQIEAIGVRNDILRAVLKAGIGGIRIAALMVMTGRSNTNVGEKLRALAAEKKIERSNTRGANCAWGPPGTWAHHQSQRDRTARSRERQRELREAERTRLQPINSTRPAFSIWDAAARDML